MCFVWYCLHEMMLYRLCQIKSKLIDSSRYIVQHDRQCLWWDGVHKLDKHGRKIMSYVQIHVPYMYQGEHNFIYLLIYLLIYLYLYIFYVSLKDILRLFMLFFFWRRLTLPWFCLNKSMEPSNGGRLWIARITRCTGARSMLTASKCKVNCHCFL